MDVCQEEYFQDGFDPSDQFDLSHRQNSDFLNCPDNHNETAPSTNQVMLDPNELQNCLFVLRESETFIGEIGQMNMPAASSKSFPEQKLLQDVPKETFLLLYKQFILCIVV